MKLRKIIQLARLAGEETGEDEKQHCAILPARSLTLFSMSRVCTLNLGPAAIVYLGFTRATFVYFMPYIFLLRGRCFPDHTASSCL
jgi:hypothetical protein